ncbi:MAG: sterol desaturase family protein [Gammaproteobacteria bacterium]|nr:sterol desaturase family protein [Gammaproteobacteria bacterium]
MTDQSINLFRISIFVLVICVLLLAEWRWPFRQYHVSKFKRLIDNLSMMMISSFVQRLAVTGGVYSVAVWTDQQQVGLLNHLTFSNWINVILSITVLDFAIYLQHRVFHTFNWLWNIHRVHHSDIGFDCTTAVRFHFIEIVLSAVYKILIVLLIGAPAMAVLLFEILLNAFALFNHSNLHFNSVWDRRLRNIVITPDMHRIHHSNRWQETNSNFGFSVPYWDRLCRTYCAHPVSGQKAMQIGLPDQPDARYHNLYHLLWMPFKAFKPFSR